MEAVLIALICLSLAQRITFTVASLLSMTRRSVFTELPTVQVFIAARNEQAALPDLLQCLERLDYPSEKLSFVIVSDGSVDSTPTLMAGWCRDRPRSRTILLPESSGKSAALQSAWKASAGAELTAIYDADVLPASSTLRILAEEFTDPRVGAAAGAVVPSNAHTNFISRYAALELYVFHQVIQTARDRLNLNPHTIGANCVYRTAALAEIGGFPQDALSEDLSISFDLIERGWRTRFHPDALVTTQVPTKLGQFWRQRLRWTRGLSREAARVHSLLALHVVFGYAERLVFFASLVAVVFGWLKWFWPVLYFVGPALNIWAALYRARVEGGMAFLLACFPMFVLDFCATIFGTLSSLHHWKPSWLPSRQGSDNS